MNNETANTHVRNGTIGSVIGETSASRAAQVLDVRDWLFKNIRPTRLYKIKNIYDATFIYYAADPDDTRHRRGELGTLVYHGEPRQYKMMPLEEQTMVGWRAMMAIQSLWGFRQQDLMRKRPAGAGVSNTISTADLEDFLDKVVGGEESQYASSMKEGVVSEVEEQKNKDLGLSDEDRKQLLKEQRLAALAKAREAKAAKRGTMSVERELENA
jgi:hypothetical protein